MLCMCCPVIKRSRQEQYQVKCDEPSKYSWERERLDPTQYRFVDLYGEVVAKLDGHIAGQQFVIERCKECCILLLDHIATVNIDECENSLIVLGPCRGSVFVRDCKNCTIFTICQQFRTRDCRNIDIFLFCTTKPIIESSKLMRFRSLALQYDKLEEHMTKASLSPFINNWDKVYDFTPDQPSNFEICPTVYDDIENMDLVKNLEKVKFSTDVSFFPHYTNISEIKSKRMLILCMQYADEINEIFYERVLRILRQLMSERAQIIATKDIYIRRGELSVLFKSKKYAKFAGRLVLLEISCNHEIIERCVQYDDEFIEIIDDADFEQHRASLYRIAQMQIDA